MAYAASGLSMLATANGFSLWHYSSADAIATVNSAGYFTGDSVNMLAVRDVIIVVDTNTPTTSLVSVLSNDGSTVDVSDGLAITETDSD
jgi:accessory colonization factor AcfC